jgi:2,4-dienoyl-CoA reductase-like NADH-dependent reductase (Old Yellow Enzyme family)
MNITNPLNVPFTLPKGSVVKNRLFKSAMSEAFGNIDGSPKPLLSTLYQTWAEGGIGMSITGNVMIDSRALGEYGNVIIENDKKIDEFTKWSKSATVNGTQCWVQLNHPGKQAPKGLNKETVSPSAIPFKDSMKSFFQIPRELSEDEIIDLVNRFAFAADIVKRAGFSGVQIHGAHGYLVSQFLSPHHNRRSDKWGGSPENRRRFVVEIYKAMRQKVGAEFPIGIKLNSADFQKGGFTNDESLETVKVLENLGIDLIEISGGTYEAPAMTGQLENKRESTIMREAYFIDFATKARSVVKTPLVLTGGFKTYEGMAKAIESGAVDFVGLGRLLAIEPDSPNRLLKGQSPLFSIKPITTGIKTIDKMGVMETTWYRSQIDRIGKGLKPKPNLSAFLVFVRYIFKFLLLRNASFKERAS